MLTNALTAKTIENVRPSKGVAQLTDGMGLYLKLQWSGEGHQWRFDYTRPTTKKRNTLVIGYAKHVTLAQARARRDEMRAQVAQGIDPADVRKEAAQEVKAAAAAAVVDTARAAKGFAPADTLKGACQDYHELHASNGNWTAGHAAQWLSMMTREVFGHEIALRPIAAVTALDVLGLIRGIEQAGRLATSRAVRKFLGNVFDHAEVMGLSKGNPARAIRKSVKQFVATQSNPAVTTPEALADVLRAIRSWPTISTRAALQCQVALFQRPDNTASMRWEHVDLDAALWVIPAAEMKGDAARKQCGSDHAVPLPSQVVALLRELQPLTKGSGWVFESPVKRGEPITNDGMSQALREMGFAGKQTPHGFRATARTMLTQTLGQDALHCEAQLAHAAGIKGEDGIVRRDVLGAAYNRATWLDQRRALVQVWADYLDALLQPKAPALAVVPPLALAA